MKEETCLLWFITFYNYFFFSVEIGNLKFIHILQGKIDLFLKISRKTKKTRI